MLLGYR